MFIRIIDETGETILKGDINKKTLAAIKRLMTLKISAGAAQEVVELFNVTCIHLPPVRKVTDTRKAAIASAMNDGIDFGELFRKTARSDFLNGKNERGWKAEFDFVLKPKNRQKILEGGFDSNIPSAKQKCGTAQSFDIADLEASAYERYRKK